MPVRALWQEKSGRTFCEDASRRLLRSYSSCATLLAPFAGLVAMAGCPNPIPSRTRSLNASAPMVLCLKTWESRSLPGLQNAQGALLHNDFEKPVAALIGRHGFFRAVRRCRTACL